MSDLHDSHPTHETPSTDRPVNERRVRMKLVGVGGAGSNIALRLAGEGLAGVSICAVNTDSQALSNCPLDEKHLIGWRATRGLSAGSDPQIGREAAEGDRDLLERALAGNELVFLVAGLGGGTGTGAAPAIADIASRQGALVVAFVTMPFAMEGDRRRKQAKDGLEALRKACDAVIPLSNDLLLQSDESTTVMQAFDEANGWIARGVRSIWSVLDSNGLINLDLASVRQIFAQRGGKTLFGFGRGRGPDAVTHAITDLRECPLGQQPEFARKADRLLLNITGGTSLSVSHINEILAAITEEYCRETQIAHGVVIDETRGDEVEIVLLGVFDSTGRGGRAARAATRAAPPPPTLPPAAATAAPADPPTATAHEAASPATATGGTAQDEFRFGEGDGAGSLDGSDSSVQDGQDLDTPTYLRRGIRITP